MGSTRLKFCGFTKLADLEFALGLGLDFAGVVLDPSSPRCVADPIELFMCISSSTARSVAVFGAIGPGYDDFDIVQYTEGQMLDPHPTIRAIRVREEDDVKSILTAIGEERFVLLDAFSSRAHGGTGLKLDWGLAKEVVRQTTANVFLAGGLTVENVSEAIQLVEPYGVDVSSGIEASPGVKDRGKMAAFAQAVRTC